MSLAESTREKIAQQIASNKVVLYMKGTPEQPQCGFSAKTTGILDALVSDYSTFDVLADEEVRQGIKVYSDWPTIPQLYVDGELVGGCDIISDMHNSGELHQVLGLPVPDRTPPEISISDAAAEKIKAGMGDHEGLGLHMSIDVHWTPQFGLQPVQGNEIVAESNGITLYLDLESAQRARGAEIDWIEAFDGSGLDVMLPGAPPPVKSLLPDGLKTMIDNHAAPVIVDVRSATDRENGEPIKGSLVLDRDVLAGLQNRPQQTPMVFVCNIGKSSRGAAEHFRKLGFTDLYSLEGGLIAWNKMVSLG